MLHILKHYAITKLRRFHDRAHLEAWQHRKVIKHLYKIVSKSPFYSKLYLGLDFQKWTEFPIIDKKQMMENFNSLNTVGIDKGNAFEIALEAERTREFTPKINDITVGLSSGTSGNRGIFLASTQEREEWAGILLAKLLPEPIYSKQEIALFMRANSNLYETTRSRRIHYQFYDLMQPIENHLRDLNCTPPSILVAPPSMLRILGKELVKGTLYIKPRKIISIAEVLDPLDETYIQKGFGQQVHQIYQCTEGFLGSTCSFGTLHINEDVVVIQKEYIDANRSKFVPIITDFRRHSQPIIRYRLNDILTESKNVCPCGSCFLSLEKVEGRCDDIVHLPGLLTLNQFIPIFPDYIRNAITDVSTEIEEYSVLQMDEGCLEIAVKTRSPIDIKPQIRNSLEILCYKMRCQMPKLHFIPYKPPEIGQKLRRIRSQFTVT